MMVKSLQSLAAPGSEKKYRKQLLLKIIAQKYRRCIMLPAYEVPNEDTAKPFGRNFAVDFLALYELKNAGKECVSKTVSNIPDEAIALSQELSLNFYERWNTNFIDGIPSEMHERFFSRLSQAGVVPYTSKDWEEFWVVKRFLSNYYPALKK